MARLIEVLQDARLDAEVADIVLHIDNLVLSNTDNAVPLNNLVPKGASRDQLLVVYTKLLGVRSMERIQQTDAADATLQAAKLSFLLKQFS